MTGLIATASATLGTHAWISQAAIDATDGAIRAAVLPSVAGIKQLRRVGRRAFTEALAKHLVAQGHAAPAAWRLCDAWPTQADAAWLEAVFAHAPLLEPILVREQRTDDGVCLDLQLPLDLAHFDVHFPTLPILPGVVQLGWAQAYGAARLGTPATCRRVEMLKFQRPLHPGDAVRLSLVHHTAQRRVQFSYAREGVECSSGRLVWEADDV